MAEAQLKQLINKRSQIKSVLTRFQKYVESCNYSNDIRELQLRLQRAQGILSDYESMQGEIECLDCDADYSTEREEFETKYYKTIADAQKLVESQSQAGAAPSIESRTNTSQLNSMIKLPAMNLPEFDGKYDRWMNFHDTFEALVNKNESLTIIQKFYYLKSALNGEAANLLSSLEVSESNYAIAWELLRERYENRKLIINTHVKGIFDLPVATRGSPKSLRSLVDTFTKHLRSLQNLNLPTNTWDVLLIHIITNKLDNLSKQEWEKISIHKQDLPTTSELIKFLTERCQILETTSSDNNQNLSNVPKRSLTATHAPLDKTACYYCKKKHYLYHCTDFLKLTVQNRWNEIKRLQLCVNCFRSNHFSNECRANPCKKCNKAHNTLLHNNDYEVREQPKFDTKATTSSDDGTANLNENKQMQTQTVLSSIISNPKEIIKEFQNESQVILSTAQINVSDAKGNYVSCRVLLDSGSQSNFITRDLFKKLELKGTKIHMPVTGINQAVSYLTQKTSTKIHSIKSSFSCELSFLILNNITGNIPSANLDIRNLEIPGDIRLADEQFHVSGKIDMLLGAGVFWNLLCIGQIRISSSVIVQKTRLGWIVAGRIPHSSSRSTTLHSVKSNIQDQLEKFWRIEECDVERKCSNEELFCEQHFVENFKREADGRFKVKLPMREEDFDFKNSLDIAVRRFHCLEKRLRRDSHFKERYLEFMAEYERLGHMSEITQVGNKQTNSIFYLPHHGVLKESSLTTKLRVVFDASVKSSSGYSLNDKLCVGANIQDELFSITLRFRKHNYVLTADVAKMYRQIKVDESQRNLQRIVWRNDVAEPLRHYQLNTLTYGTAPASFLATRCLKQLGLENKKKFPLASNSIIHDFYMDDLITGTRTIGEAIKLKGEISAILGSAKLELRQWSSNNVQIFSEYDIKCDIDKYYIADKQNTKTLGLVWDTNKDTLSYLINIESNCERTTKRVILATVSKIFDPLGLIGPITIKTKLILQRLWREKLEWDESVPLDIYTDWNRIKRSLKNIENIALCRQVTIPNYAEIELHGFCDASEQAYGCCVYIRSKDNFGNIASNLLCAKSRVAPLKTITIPRLELCGAVLLTQLMDKVMQSFNERFFNIYYWCDSTIALSWLKGEPQNFNVFVANRIAEIQRASDKARWYHIRTEDNPADIISRGVGPDILEASSTWWHGPSWLSGKDPYPTSKINLLREIPEKRQIQPSIFISVNSIETHLFSKISNFTKLQRTYAYILRFIYNVSINKSNKTKGILTVQELNNATNKLVSLTQEQYFGEEMKALKKSKPISNTSKILPLSPFLDKHDLIRVGGRLTMSSLAIDRKHPIILPAKCTFTELLVDYEHKRNLHIGVEGTLASIRRKFWPLHGRNVVKNVIFKCIKCARFRSNTITPLMGNLPKERINPSRPFLHTGVDYAGPFLIKDGKLRNRKLTKAYLCVFICFATKAIHLELANDLSTPAFLNVFKRFMARRGICKTMYSDNGTNFVGANNELRRVIDLLSDTKFSEHFHSNAIDWRFIPTRSPHFGGLYEAAVKSAKAILRKVVGNLHLTYEELSTVFTQIEAMLNSRPLTPISEDPTDLLALTPGHFLIGDVLNCVPQEDETEVPANRLSYYNQLNQVTQHFWKRWSAEYVHTLQTRKKWYKTSPAINVGTMVLVRGENTPPLLWPLGRVVELHRGADGEARVATIKTASGSVKRAVVKLCVLPIE